MSGQIVDASLIAAPRQRNNDDEKKAIKEGRIPEDWKDKPAKLRRRTAMPAGRSSSLKLSRARTAQRHRSIWHSAVRLSEPHLDRSRLWLHPSMDRDRRCCLRGPPAARRLARQGQYSERDLGRYRLPIGGQRGVPGQERFCQPHPSQEAEGPYHARGDAAGQQREIRIRSRVEHVFAEQKERMDLFIRTIGIARATIKIGLANLVYNIKRLIFLRRAAVA